MEEPKGIEYLRSFGITYPSRGVAKSAQEASEVDNQVRYPIVLKIVVSADVPPKTSAGGVIQGISTPAEAIKGFELIHERVRKTFPNAFIDSVLVCREAPEGVEVIIGSIDDPLFRLTVMFGLGGNYSEALEYVNFRIAPPERMGTEEIIYKTKACDVLRDSPA